MAGAQGPWAPATNALLLRHEALAGPAVVGGPGAVVAALVAASKERGATLRTGCEVAAIRFRQGRAIGVTLASGEEHDADRVLVTADPRHALLEWVPAAACPPETARRLVRYRSRGSTAVVHLALGAPLRFAGRPDLAVARAVTGEGLDDLERSFDPVKYGRDAERPFLDVHVPTVANPELAPAGHAVVTVLAHGFGGEASADEVGDRVVATLDEVAPGTASSVVARQVLRPVELARRHGSGGGHLFHGDHGLDQLLARPVPECAGYRTPWPGLWLGGSGSWPGGGITGLPGRLAARALLAARGAEK